MIYVLAYCVVGVLLFAIQKWLTYRHPTQTEKMLQKVDACMKLSYADGTSFFYLSADIVGGLLALVIAVIGWPVLALNLLRRFKKSPDDAIDESVDPAFYGSCIREVTLQEIESVERVIGDDIGEPALPFGHLNDVWLNFKNQVQPGDELWLFRYTPDDLPLGVWKHSAEGYALMRGGKFVAKILSNAG